MKKYYLLSIAAVLTGCAAITHTSSISQATGKELVVGSGDIVAKITTEKSLPNIVGKADIWGRTTPTGQTVVTYEGVRDGKALFVRKSIDIETGATTMNTMPTVISNTSTTTSTGYVAGKQFNSTSTTTGPSTVIAPNTPQPKYTARNGRVIAVDLSKLPASFIVEGYQVNVNSADENTVTYNIVKRNE